MENEIQTLTTRTGLKFQIRPATARDGPTIAEFFTHLTHEDLRFRFLSSIKELSHERIVELAEVDHKLVENFLAFDASGSPMIATAMLACDPTLDRGEVAIAIRGDYKHKGVSWELLAHLARFAEAKGVRSLESIENRQNHAAIELEHDMGFTVEANPDDPTLLLVRKTLRAQ